MRRVVMNTGGECCQGRICLVRSMIGCRRCWGWNVLVLVRHPADADYIDTDTDPSAVAALDRPDVALPDCDSDDDTCTDPEPALENTN
jgi:hypothetical protein